MDSIYQFYIRKCFRNKRIAVYVFLVDNWQKKKKLGILGMPRYIASGSHEFKSTKYRFLVIDRYGKDLWKIFEENNKQFPEHTVYKLALQIVRQL